MPLAKNRQLALKIESVPGTAVAPAGTDVFDLLDGGFTFTQNFLEREPSGGSLSRSAQAPGTSEGEVTGRLDLKGSGTATTLPRWARVLDVGLYERIDIDHLNVSSLTEDLVPGDQLTLATSNAVCIVMAFVGQTGSPVSIPVVVKSGTPGGTQAITSALKGAGVATTTASPLTADQGHAYKPLSSSELTVDTTAGWTASDPAAGKGVVVKDGTTIVGEAFFIAQNGTVATLEMSWGTLAAGFTLHSQTSGGTAVTATIAGVPAITQTKGKTGTARFNRAGLNVRLSGARSTFSMEAEAGAAGVVSFTVRGSCETRTDDAQLTASGLETTTPPRFIGPNGLRGAAHLDGVAVPTRRFSFEAGNDLVRRADANALEGDAGGAITGRQPTVSLQIDQPTVQAFDLHGKLRLGTTVRFGVQLGSTSGNRVAIVVPAAQITGFTDDDADGSATETVTLAPRLQDLAGNDEVYIAFS